MKTRFIYFASILIAVIPDVTDARTRAEPEDVAVYHLAKIMSMLKVASGVAVTKWTDLEKTEYLAKLNHTAGRDLREFYVFVPDAVPLLNQDGHHVVVIAKGPLIKAEGPRLGRKVIVEMQDSQFESEWIDEEYLKQEVLTKGIALPPVFPGANPNEPPRRIETPEMIRSRLAQSSAMVTTAAVIPPDAPPQSSGLYFRLIILGIAVLALIAMFAVLRHWRPR